MPPDVRDLPKIGGWGSKSRRGGSGVEKGGGGCVALGVG